MIERPRVVDDVVTSDLPGNETVVSTPNQASALILNPMASVVLELCDGSHRVEDIVEFIRDHVKVDESVDVGQDVRRVIARLAEAGILVDEPAVSDR